MIGFIKRLLSGKDKENNSNNCEGGDFIYLKVKRERYFGLAGIDFCYLKVRAIDFHPSSQDSLIVLGFFSSGGHFCGEELAWWKFFDLNLSTILIDESDFNKAKIKYIGDV